ncbi:hypothetical protein ABZ639_10485 [Saccharomonospora sp. NPDC006951]
MVGLILVGAVVSVVWGLILLGIVWIALRGSEPRERPAILRAVATLFPAKPAALTRRQRARSSGRDR